MKTHLMRSAALVAFSWLLFSPTTSLVEARSDNNCFCDGTSTGWLPLVFVDPICVQVPYGSQTFADNGTQCALLCASYADGVSGPNVCGQQCDRDGQQNVVSWSWSGSWNYTGSEPDSGNQDSGGLYSC